MTPPAVDPHSRSEIVRAHAIFVLRIDEARIGAWSGEVGAEARDVDLRVEVRELAKGALAQAIGAPFALHVRQRGASSGIVMEDYGVWGSASLEVGSELLAFCPGASPDAVALLDDGPCEQLLEPPGAALLDVRAAMALERARAAAVVAAALREAATRGAIFARYAWARALTAGVEAPALFEQVIQLVVGAETSFDARRGYVTSVYQSLLARVPPPVGPTRRFADALLAMLEVPAAAPLRANTERVYLPNLVEALGPAASPALRAWSAQR